MSKVMEVIIRLFIIVLCIFGIFVGLPLPVMAFVFLGMVYFHLKDKKRKEEKEKLPK